MLRCGTLSALMLLSPLGAAPAREPIPPEVWNLTEARSEGTGAIVVERSASYDREAIERRILVRIVSEKGKAVADLFHLPAETEHVWGRVVLRDGGERFLDPKLDVLKKDDVRAGYLKVSHLEVLPPGLTADCVVELRWEEPMMVAYRRSYWHMRSQPKVQSLSLPYPILKQTIRISKNYPYAWSLASVSKAEPLDKEEGFVLRNQPAVPDAPFAPEGLRRLTRLYFYQIPPELQSAARKGEDAFWAAAGKEHFRPLLDRVTAGKRAKAWSAEQVRQLPGTPQAAAYELALRLDSNIRNTSVPTFQEAKDLRKDAAEEGIHAKNLEETVGRGFTNGAGMLYLYLHLLEEAKIQHRLLFVADRDVQVMNRSRLDPDQWSAVLVMVEEPGKPPLVVNPAMRFAQPGLIDGDYQGMTALAVHPGTWACEFVQVPVQAARTNVRHYDCRLDIGEEEDRYEVKATFAGLPEYQERRRYMALEPAGQAKALREDLESAGGEFRISKAEVQHATDPRKDLAWVIEGRREREPGRRLEVVPFLGVPAPLKVPASWPEVRVDPIVMPHLGTTAAIATFRLPAGWALLPMDPLDHKNAFGSVAWSQKVIEGQAGPEVQVTFVVEVATLGGRVDLYPQLKAFLGWIEEASKRSVVLERR